MDDFARQLQLDELEMTPTPAESPRPVFPILIITAIIIGIVLALRS